MNTPRVVCLLTLAMLCVAPLRAGAEFTIRGGDTVVFLGDSITAEGSYGRMIENYTLLRYPERKVRFINAGWGGDTAAGGLARLDRDVFSRGATLLTVAYGVNDIGWGGLADDAHRNKYLDSIRGIVRACNERNVRVFICSAALTRGDIKDDQGYLQKMCDDGMAIARELGAGSIDVQRSMRRIAQRMEEAHAAIEDKQKHETMHAADGIHLNGLGQLAMGLAILKGLGAPAEVSSALVDVKTGSSESTGCKISGLTIDDVTVSFDRLDEGLPLNLGPLWQLNFRFLPIPDTLNRYMLAVRGLRAGEYEVVASERTIGRWSAEQLAGGINIASAVAEGWGPGGPWDAQAALLKMITDAKGELNLSEKLARDYLKHSPANVTIAERTADAIQRLEELQRTIARPVAYRFVIRPAPARK